MSDNPNFNKDKTPWDDSPTLKKNKELENSLQSVVNKLESLYTQLDDNEKLIFNDIVRSAAMHTSVIGAVETGSTVAFKPVSVHISKTMRDTLATLPKTLKIPEEEQK